MNFTGTHHIALRTPNYAAMEEFYTETLGLRVVQRWDDVNNIFIDIGGTTIELSGRDEATAGVKPSGGWDHIAFHVESVDEVYAELTAKGVPFTVEPRNFKNVRIAFFTDPDGNLLELFEEPRK
jgi:catechol 2,3-dioxygenase-like lactoylglutathione lyase family enzyme